jgi:hypothetical protein
MLLVERNSFFNPLYVLTFALHKVHVLTRIAQYFWQSWVAVFAMCHYEGW